MSLHILRCSRHNLNCRGILLTAVICVHGSMINKARSHASTALSCYDMRNALCCQHTYTGSSRHFSHQKHSNTNVRLKKMRLRRYFVWDVGLKCLIACVVCFLSIYISNDFYITGKSYLSPLQLTLFSSSHLYRFCRVVWATTLLEKRERTPNIFVPLKRHCCFIYTHRSQQQRQIFLFISSWCQQR